jgi:hypothetical protein
MKKSPQRALCFFESFFPDAAGPETGDSRSLRELEQNFTDTKAAAPVGFLPWQPFFL